MSKLWFGSYTVQDEIPVEKAVAGVTIDNFIAKADETGVLQPLPTAEIVYGEEVTQLPDKYNYTFAVNTAGSGYLDGDVVTCTVGSMTFTITLSVKNGVVTIQSATPTKGMSSFSGSSYATTGGHGTGFKVTINKTDSINSFLPVYGSLNFENVEEIESDTPIPPTQNLTSFSAPNLQVIDGTGVFNSLCKNNYNIGPYVDFHSLREIKGDHACYEMFMTGGGGGTPPEYAMFDVPDFSSLEIIDGDYACYGMFWGRWKMEGTLTFPKLHTIKGKYACGYMFYTCEKMSGIEFPELRTVEGEYALYDFFGQSSSYKSAVSPTLSFPKLESIKGNYAFNQYYYYVSGVTSVSFPELKTIEGNYVFKDFFYSKSSPVVSMPKLETVISSGYIDLSGFNATSIDISGLKTIDCCDSTGSSCPITGCAGSNQTSVDLGNLEEVINRPKYGLGYLLQSKTKVQTVDLHSLTSLEGDYAFTYSFSGCSALTSVNLSSLVLPETPTNYYFNYTFQNCKALNSNPLDDILTGDIDGTYMLNYTFSGCTGLTSITYTNLTGVYGGYMLYYTHNNCSNLQSISFPALTEIGNQKGTSTNAMSSFYGCCSGCNALTSASFPELTTVQGGTTFGYAFASSTSGNTTLTELRFPKLSAIKDYTSTASPTTSTSLMFQYACRNRNNMNVYFPTLTANSFAGTSYLAKINTNIHPFYNMFNGGSNNTIHLPAAMQNEAIGLTTFGAWILAGTNNKFVFDL